MSEDEPGEGRRACYAGIVVNTHAMALSPGAPLHRPVIMSGELAEALSPEQSAAATQLCDPLGDLIIGLCAHYDTRQY